MYIFQMYVVKFDIFTRLILHERNVIENQEKVEPKKPSIVSFDTIPVIWIYKPLSESTVIRSSKCFDWRL